MDATSHTAVIDGLAVHYRQAGTGDVPLLLVHGSFLSAAMWQPVLAALAAHQRVIALDRPVAGLTARPQPDPRTGRNPYTPEAQADLLVALLDHLGIERAVLVGHSAGGTTALLAAQRAPQRVAGLVLLGAMVYSGYAVSEFPPWLRRVLAVFAPLGIIKMQLMLPRVLPLLYRSFWQHPAHIPAATWQQWQHDLYQPGWARALWYLLVASHALHLPAVLPNVTVPVLVVSGQHDRTVPVGESVRLATALPQARLVLLPDCAHMPPAEQPVAFVAAVQPWLAAHDLTTSRNPDTP